MPPEFLKLSEMARTEGELVYAFDPVSGVLRAADTTKDFGGGAFVDFSGNLNPELNSILTFNNECGHSSVGFHVREVNGGSVQFQGSYDGVNYSPIQMRELSSNGYIQSTDHQEDFLGSISCLKNLRFKRIVAGSVETPIVGRMSKDAATLEGIENANPPHRFGNELFHRGFYLTNGTTGNMNIYDPPPENKFVLTYIAFGVISTAGANVTFHEFDDAGANKDGWVFSTYVKTNANESQSFNIGFPTPFVASSMNNNLYFSTDAAVNIRGVIHGYNTTV